MATKPSVIARPVVATAIATRDQDRRDRRSEREPLHEEQRERHQGDDERHEPPRAAADSVRRRHDDDPFDDAGEREHDGDALDPPDAQRTRSIRSTAQR